MQVSIMIEVVIKLATTVCIFTNSLIQHMISRLKIMVQGIKVLHYIQMKTVRKAVNPMRESMMFEKEF